MVNNSDPPPQGNGSQNGSSDHSFLGAITLVQTFSGNEDSISVEDFIRSLVKAAELTKWTDDQKIAIAKFRTSGPAALFLEANKNFEGKTWEEIKSAFIGHFGTKESREAARSKLRDCAQSEKETVSQFATRIKLLGNKLSTVKTGESAETTRVRQALIDEELLSAFRHGLKPSLRRFVMTHSDETLEKAIETAEREEMNAATVEGVYAVHETKPAQAMHVREERSRPQETPRGIHSEEADFSSSIFNL